MSRRRKRSRPAQPQQQAQDAYINTLNRTGLMQPNWMNAIAYPETRTTQMYQLWNGLYRDSWIPAAIVDIPAEDMLKSWITITTELAPEDMDQLDRAIRITQTKTKLLEGLKWGRLYGGAAGLIMLEGEDTPEALAQPLDLSRVRLGGYKGIRIFDRYIGVYPSVELVENINSPDFGLPAYYHLTGQTGVGSGIRVHYSRILRFTGADVPELERIAEQYWGISVLERVMGELAKRDNTSANVAGLVERANVLIRKLKGFTSKLGMASDGTRENVYQTLYAQNQTLNNFSTLVIGNEDDAANLQYSFAGIADVYELFMLDIAGAAKIPASKLYGRSPAGLNATGESDLQNYYDSIAQEQEAHLRPVLDKLLPVIATSTWGFVPDDLDFTFNSPRSASEEQKATIATGIAGQIAQLVNAGVVSPKQALKELKASADITGRWTNITDEEIEQADDMAGVPGEDLSAISQLLGGTTTASDAEWEESKHPRDEDGKFASSGGGQSKADLSGRRFSDGQSVNEHFGGKGGLLSRKKSAEGRWVSSLSKEEERSITEYTADLYGDVNKYLRGYGDKLGDQRQKEVDEGIKNIDSALSKFENPEDFVTYRAINPDAFSGVDLNSLVGKAYTDNAYMSTSPLLDSSAVNKNLLMEIKVPKGQNRGAYINKLAAQYKDKEYEYLLPRGSKFNIVGIYEKNGKPVIQMEMI